MLIGLLCEEMSAVIVAEKESMVVSFVKRKPIVLEEIAEDDVISKVKFDEGTDAVAASISPSRRNPRTMGMATLKEYAIA